MAQYSLAMMSSTSHSSSHRCIGLLRPIHQSNSRVHTTPYHTILHHTTPYYTPLCAQRTEVCLLVPSGFGLSSPLSVIVCLSAGTAGTFLPDTRVLYVKYEYIFRAEPKYVDSRVSCTCTRGGFIQSTHDRPIATQPLRVVINL